jgi:hypothetical protein
MSETRETTATHETGDARETGEALSTSDLVGRDGDAGTPDVATARGDDRAAADDTPLLPADELEGFDGRWQEIQTRFVDSPQDAVQAADALVAELMQRLAQTFADERGRLEGQWGEGENVGTEELRVALQRYRSFFQRLLTT